MAFPYGYELVELTDFLMTCLPCGLKAMSWSNNPMLKGLDAFQRVSWAKRLAKKKELTKTEIEALQEILIHDPYPESRVTSAEIIRLHQLGSAKKTLEIALLEDEAFEVRLIAAEALGQLKDIDSIKVLKEALLEENHVLVRKAIVQTLQKFEAFEQDIKFLEKALDKEDDPLIGELYAQVLEGLEKKGKFPPSKVIRRFGHRLGYLEETPSELIETFMKFAKVAEADYKENEGRGELTSKERAQGKDSGQQKP